MTHINEQATETHNESVPIDEINAILTEDPPPPTGGGLSLSSIVLLLGVVFAIGTIGWAFTQQRGGQPTRGPAPDFTVTTFDGVELTLSEQRGSIIVLNFWASWCAPCRDEAPDLQEVYEAYQDQGVIVLGLTYLDERADSLGFIEEMGLTYPNAPDVGTRISKDRYSINGVPETFVIGRDGQVAHFFYGPLTGPQLIEVLESLLAEEAEAL